MASEKPWKENNWKGDVMRLYIKESEYATELLSPSWMTLPQQSAVTLRSITDGLVFSLS